MTRGKTGGSPMVARDSGGRAANSPNSEAADVSPTTIQRRGTAIAEQLGILPAGKLRLVEIRDPEWRRLCDAALDTIHYARSCQRVGRCMRLGIFLEGQWVGGIVLGSTFPNIDSRDQFLGLKRHVRNVSRRGLSNPWCSENIAYWSRLQSIVNHARTFVFPDFQGRGIGVRAHGVLLQDGV